MLVLSGIPAAGKSTFARWLEQERGFAHLDLENAGLDRFSLAPMWQRVCQLPPPDISPFIDALRTIGRPLVLDWGYPVAFLPFVEALHREGLDAWRFDADLDAARAAFERRRTVAASALNIQLAAIAEASPQIRMFYGKRIIRTRRADGTFEPPEAICALLAGH